MTKDDLQLLFAYDRWANNRVLRAASTLSTEQFTRDLGGEWGWLTFWKAPSHTPAFLAEFWARHDALFRPDAFPDLEAVRLKWAEIEKEQVEFVNSATEESLRTMFPVRGAQLSLAHLMHHLANHSTYHRGQVAMLMPARRQAITHRFPRIPPGTPPSRDTTLRTNEVLPSRSSRNSRPRAATISDS